MSRKVFLTVASLIALGVGGFALAAPAAVLGSKGVLSSPAEVWTREVGVLLIALGVMAFAVRSHAASSTLRVLMFGNAIVQLGLLPIEILAYQGGVITNVAGIIPNSIVHALLATGFLYFAVTMRPPAPQAAD